MRIHVSRLVLGGVFALASACGGGDGGDNNGPPGGNSGAFTASIDGSAWAADELTISARTVPQVPGGFVIVGSQAVSSTNAHSISISLYNIRGTGTYALGVLPNVIGGLATYGDASTGFVTPFNGHAGTLTLTTLTATRIAGTFSFDASDNNGAVKHITSGQFDLPLESGGALPAVPENAGGRVTASVAGSPYNASLVAVTQSGASGFAFSSTSDTLTVTVSLNGVTAPGTYDAGSASAASGRLISVSRMGGGATWGTGAGTTGSVVVTSMTADRVKGTFTGSLAPQSGGGGPIAVSGDFDIGIE